MNQFGSLIVFFFFFFLFCDVQAQNGTRADASPPDAVSAFHPSLAVVVGILSAMLSLTFLFIAYAKFFLKGEDSSAVDQDDDEDDLDHRQHRGLFRTRSRFSGIDKTVIESLPFFRFSSLKGFKEGLECVVCLSKFEDTEILRLLPKCKHAFHIECVDKWLENHSTCPLCRHKVDPEDLTLFTYSNSLRLLGGPPELMEDPNVELFVCIEQDNQGSSRFSVGSSLRKIDSDKKDNELPLQVGGNADDGVVGGEDDRKPLHDKFKHKIIVSDVVFKNRWSDVSSSDLMFLNSEMLSLMSSNRFSSFLSPNSQRFMAAPSAFEDGSPKTEHIIEIKEDMERKRLLESEIISRISTSHSVSDTSELPSTLDPEANITSRFLNNPSEKRSMSEIINLSRFKNRTKESSVVGNNEKEERRRRLWIPIARRTVQWFASRERSSQQQSDQYNTRSTAFEIMKFQK
ncbi:PREDICTED: putative RING-H2 finger protein ATL12 [Nelumbo nucifera]|uniref:RING-type E3 ubiquitin transferase n=1 Tax=Nelumbo nucifera TaxID=4432 RepID=A0A1U7ZLB8_NELNU|nr:PREDICTED: putative RING-H2 finger protein ATL12 [Nelumbo nucifera]